MLKFLSGQMACIVFQSSYKVLEHPCLQLQAIKVAEVHPDLVSRHVIVTEWIPGEKLCDSSAADVKTLCSTLLNCYLIQVPPSPCAS